MLRPYFSLSKVPSDGFDSFKSVMCVGYFVKERLESPDSFVNLAGIFLCGIGVS